MAPPAAATTADGKFVARSGVFGALKRSGKRLGLRACGFRGCGDVAGGVFCHSVGEDAECRLVRRL